MFEQRSYPAEKHRDILELGRLRFYVSMILLGWTVAIAFFFFLGRWQLNRSAYDKTRHTALNAFEKDLIYRQWVAMHGGVYVPVTPKTPPNPYLTMVEHRDLQTEAGPLTMVNPAYMTRQVFELQIAEGIRARGHLTSLRPIRPENQADEWETRALEDFEKGADEKVSIETIDGERYMRFMRPFKVNKSCLKYHAQQGYKIGDIRGGISVSIPMAFIDHITLHDIIYLAFGCGTIWLIGCAGILFGGARLSRVIRHRHDIEKEALKNEELYRMSQRAAHIGSWDWDIANDRIYWSPQISEILGIEYEKIPTEKDAFMGLIINEDRQKIYEAVEFSLKRNRDYEVDFRILNKNGSIKWLSAAGRVMADSFDKPYRMLGIIQDITERKHAEAEISNIRKREIAIGMEIQHQLLLGRPPKGVKNAQVSAISMPAQQIGGDFYDFVQYDTSHFDLFLGDVMGKGISAALFGAATKNQLLRAINDLICASHLTELPTLEEIVTFAHNEMSPRLIAVESFATVCIARINTDTMKMGLVDCGHTATIHYQVARGVCELIKSDNYPMGFDPEESYRQLDIEFERGDLFLFYSDGVVELKNAKDELYGLDRLQAFIHEHGYMDADELLNVLTVELENFADGTAFQDDVTYIIVKV